MEKYYGIVIADATHAIGAACVSSSHKVLNGIINGASKCHLHFWTASCRIYKKVTQFVTKEVDGTYEAMRKILQKYRQSIDMGFLHPDSSVAKATTQPFIPKAKVSMAFRQKLIYDCNPCKQSGHDQKSCPFKEGCLHCKTKTHRYWGKGFPFYEAWAAKKDTGRAQAGLPPFPGKKAHSTILQPGAPPASVEQQLTWR